MKAEIGKYYRHYKNGETYLVVAIGRDSDTLEELVVYEGQYDSKEFGKNPVWTRSRKEFEEKVIFDGKKVPRFTNSSRSDSIKK